jgi:DNA repair protein RadC
MDTNDREALSALVGTRADKCGYRELAELSSAPETELRKLFGARGAARFRAALVLGRRLVGATLKRGVRLSAAADVSAHYRGRLASAPVEEFWALALDVRHRVMEELMIGRGSLTGVDVHPREAFRPLIRMGAAAVIFVHNHPSQDPTPSRQDIDLTKRLVETGELVGIKVLDHIVVAGDGFTSLADRNWT